jgi:NAD(P)-dependent dehydrogenase (short-subunit alcohol dehydrogenase family)
MRPLEGKIALVAGATRGAGRGIACMLGEAGATVYCTGRSTRGNPATPGRPETIEETAEMVTARGGKGIPVRVDHLVPEQVAALIEKIRMEQGHLDVLVNDIWGGETLSEWGKPFWELDLEKGFRMLQLAVHTHLITSRYAAPLMIEQGRGLIIEITDGDHFGYRGSLFYDLVKTSVIRLAWTMDRELRKHCVTALVVTPGFLRSEEMLDHFGVTEANWQDGAKIVPDFIASETPFFVGRAVAALTADPRVAEKAGRVFSSWNLSDEYGFTDIDGRSPHWGRHVAERYPAWPVKKADDLFYSYWLGPFDSPTPPPMPQ